MMTTNDKRLIEAEFPLNPVPLDSVHEKNVCYGPSFINEDPNASAHREVRAIPLGTATIQKRYS